MRALLLFESMFGNTQVIAKAVADGLASTMSIDLVEVGSAPNVIGEDVDLLVVGGPTHAFGMSREKTRQSAADQAEGPLVSKGTGVREWIARMEKGTHRLEAAAFDTRINKPRLPGSASRGIEKGLRRLGFRIVAPAMGFYVDGTTGPLVDGEAERARRWGHRLGTEVAARRRGLVENQVR